MDENENDELIEKLKTLREMLSDTLLARAGFKARMEGIETELNEIGLRPERAGSLLVEFVEMEARLTLLKLEMKRVSDWSIANLPSEFHLTLDD
jgi:hypothetical protein